MSQSANIYHSGCFTRQQRDRQEKQIQWLNHLSFLGLRNVSNNHITNKEKYVINMFSTEWVAMILILSWKQIGRKKKRAYYTADESCCVQIIVL